MVILYKIFKIFFQYSEIHLILYLKLFRAFYFTYTATVIFPVNLWILSSIWWDGPAGNGPQHPALSPELDPLDSQGGKGERLL